MLAKTKNNVRVGLPIRVSWVQVRCLRRVQVLFIIDLTLCYEEMKIGLSRTHRDYVNPYEDFDLVVGRYSSANYEAACVFAPVSCLVTQLVEAESSLKKQHENVHEGIIMFSRSIRTHE